MAKQDHIPLLLTFANPKHKIQEDAEDDDLLAGVDIDNEQPKNQFQAEDPEEVPEEPIEDAIEEILN